MTAPLRNGWPIVARDATAEVAAILTGLPTVEAARFRSDCIMRMRDLCAKMAASVMTADECDNVLRSGLDVLKGAGK